MITLVNVVREGDYQYKQEIPLGLGAVGAFLRENGYEVIYKNCFPDNNHEGYMELPDNKSDIYGFQLNMINYHQVKEAVKSIKSHNSNSITIFGGPFLASISDKILEKESLFNYMIVGEGEHTVLELLDAINKKKGDLSNIKGLIWKDDDGKIIKNDLRNVVEDLDSLPFVSRDGLEDAFKDELYSSIRICSSRGCIGNCSFCCVNLFNKIQRGKIWRGRSPKHTVDELEYLSTKYGARIFNFADSSFEDPGRMGKKRSEKICREIIKRKLPVSLKIYLRCETMKSEDDIKLLKLYKNAGIDVIIVGAESANNDELNLYGKKSTVEDNVRTLKILKDLDLFYYIGGMIMFGPNSTLDTIIKNIKFMKDMGIAHSPDTISNTLLLLRDCRLYHQLKKDGRVIENPDEYWAMPKYKMIDLQAERLMSYWQNLMFRYPNAKTMHRLETNLGNLVYRLTNKMNKPVLDYMGSEYRKLKSHHKKMRNEFSNEQAGIFVKTIKYIENDKDDSSIRSLMDKFYNIRCMKYINKYTDIYNGHVQDIKDGWFNLNGIVFTAFLSNVSDVELERVWKDE